MSDTKRIKHCGSHIYQFHIETLGFFFKQETALFMVGQHGLPEATL